MSVATGEVNPIFGALENLRGQEAPARASAAATWSCPSRIFIRSGSALSVHREVGGEERRAKLDRVEHRRAVGIGQHVVGQVLLLVLIGKPSERPGRRPIARWRASCTPTSWRSCRSSSRARQLIVGEGAGPVEVAQRIRRGKALRELLELEIDAHVAVARRQEPGKGAEQAAVHDVGQTATRRAARCARKIA